MSVDAPRVFAAFLLLSSVPGVFPAGTVGTRAFSFPVAVAAEAGEQQSLVVSGPQGSGRIVLRVSRDWSIPQPDITRAVVTIHGRLRNAGEYDDIAHEALAEAGAAGSGTLLVTPRFAGPGEAGPDTLRWKGSTWMDGEPAAFPASLSSFDVLDAIIARLSDRRLFPSLQTIVLVGHSAGGQFVQRYAVLARAPARAGITVRSVVANPSSYAYFTSRRPMPVGACPGFDNWKYGLRNLPASATETDAADLERRYVRRSVIYLLGARDIDPKLPALDRSCAAETQGANHLARGQDFFRSLQIRHPRDLNQSLHEVPGVGHDGRAMLTSDCALAAIYDSPLCGHSSGPAAGARPQP
jgi:pimeloyl-ACP methyl ester carboxylesterase